MALMIGTQAGGVGSMVTVESIGIRTKAIEATPVHFSRYMKRGDGTIVGQGFKRSEWHLNGIRNAHWDAFKACIPGQSAYLYIRTYSEDGKTEKNYLVLAHWSESPPVRDHDTNVVVDFSIIFEQMVEQS